MRRDPIGYFRGLGFQIGDGCRLIAPTHGMLGTEPALVRIGNDVTISTEVLFVTHDGAVWPLRPDVGPVDVYGRIEIADGAFVGARAILLPGIRIGRRAVVGAGAVVSRSVPDNVVVAGAPARNPHDHRRVPPAVRAPFPSDRSDVIRRETVVPGENKPRPPVGQARTPAPSPKTGPELTLALKAEDKPPCVKALGRRRAVKPESSQVAVGARRRRCRWADLLGAEPLGAASITSLDRGSYR